MGQRKVEGIQKINDTKGLLENRGRGMASSIMYPVRRMGGGVHAGPGRCDTLASSVWSEAPCRPTVSQRTERPDPGLNQRSAGTLQGTQTIEGSSHPLQAKSQWMPAGLDLDRCRHGSGWELLVASRRYAAGQVGSWQLKEGTSARYLPPAFVVPA
jgi:hypothetical protein